ncbi:unnamed protein product [Schistosoma curassoni]|uniref:Transposase n=1 Tax=Schistosoma curassoni TaxID=6186 RepID=A0A183JG99_9TREM|nr:unnamed protein product [Schistosoma curassoni]
MKVNKQVKKSIRADKQKYVEGLGVTADKAARERNMKQLYDTTNKLTRKYSKSERPVKDKESKPITEIEEQLKRWLEQFEELLNKPATLNPPAIEAARTDLPIPLTSLATEEIGIAIRQITSWNVAGPDNIPREALKSHTEATANMLHVLLRKIWEEKKVPLTDWKEGYLIKTRKKDLIKCENCRGITPLSVSGNVFISITEQDECFSRRQTSRSTDWIA